MPNPDTHQQILAIMQAHARDDEYIKTALAKLTANRRVELHEMLMKACVGALYPPNAAELSHISRVLYHFNRYSTADDDRIYALFYGGIAALLKEQLVDSMRLLGNMTRYLDTLQVSAHQQQLIAYMWYFVAISHYVNNQQSDAQTSSAHAQTMFGHAQNDTMVALVHTLTTYIKAPYTDKQLPQCKDLLGKALRNLYAYLTSTSTPVQSTPTTVPREVSPRKNDFVVPHGHAPHRSIPEEATGWSYDRLFGPYILGAAHIKIVDAFIGTFPQIKNLEAFLKTVEKYTDTTNQVVVMLETSRSDDNHSQHQQLINLRDKVVKQNIIFDWEYKERKVIHDRHIIVNYTRWKIVLGRGLDIYKPFKPSMSTDLNQRPCRAFEITYVSDF